MGLFTKSMIILLFAISTPLLYRQFANDNTIKFMNSYYSNYKVIDQFLRQSAGHIDKAKEYVNTEQLKVAVEKINLHINNLIETTKTKLQAPKEVKEKEVKRTSGEDNVKKEEEEEKPTIRLCKCPNEDFKGQQVRLWNKQELSKFDGNSDTEQDVYLGFLGLVYNVTANMQHYARGAEYNAFAGRDATRAFVTGNFTHDLHDNIKDLDESLFSQIESWASFYNSHYPILGRIEGEYFDSQGCATSELVRVYQVFNKLEQDKARSREQEKNFPECNSEWNSDLKKGKVWCSTKSGGIDREWVGVPRIYSQGESQKCACFNLDSPDAPEYERYMSVYPGCDPRAIECTLTQ